MQKASLPLRNLVIFSKKWYQKTMISAAKTLKKFKNIESPKMVSKRLYGHYLRSYEQIKKNRILSRILSWMDGWWMVDGWNHFSSFFSSYLYQRQYMYNIYIIYIYIYICLYNFVLTKIIMGFKIWSSWGVGYSNSKFTICTTIFDFSSKTFFAGLDTFFGTFLILF